jgi:hypothetical protein
MEPRAFRLKSIRRRRRKNPVGGSEARGMRRIDKTDAVFSPMDYPDIEVRGGKIRDCVNVVFRCFTVEEVGDLLKRLGWIGVAAGHSASLLGREPALQFQYPIVPEVVRYHIRLFVYGDEVVGNVHFNRISLDLERLDLHKSDHEKGLEFLMGQLRGFPYRIAVEEGKCRILTVSKCF